MDNSTKNQNVVVKKVKLILPTALLSAVRQKANEACLTAEDYILMTLKNATK